MEVSYYCVFFVLCGLEISRVIWSNRFVSLFLSPRYLTRSGISNVSFFIKHWLVYVVTFSRVIVHIVLFENLWTVWNCSLVFFAFYRYCQEISNKRNCFFVNYCWTTYSTTNYSTTNHPKRTKQNWFREAPYTGIFASIINYEVLEGLRWYQNTSILVLVLKWLARKL